MPDGLLVDEANPSCGEGEQRIQEGTREEQDAVNQASLEVQPTAVATVLERTEEAYEP